MIALVDNRDSFTFNLVQALQGLGAEVRVSSGPQLVTGIARRVDASGTLWVDVEGVERAIRAGDVEIVRWADAMGGQKPK